MILVNALSGDYVFCAIIKDQVDSPVSTGHTKTQCNTLSAATIRHLYRRRV